MRIFILFALALVMARTSLPIQAALFTLGTTALLEGPSAGTDSVVLAVSPAPNAWTATTNATWLHLDTSKQSGMSSTNLIFTFDANLGGTRIGTLTIAGQILTITQAGSTYTAIPQNPISIDLILHFNVPQKSVNSINE